MKIPESAFGPMLQMVVGSLPYSEPFEPVTPESIAVIDILGAVTRQDTNLKDLEGFIYHLAEKIDKSPKKRESTRYLLLKLIDTLQTYERNITHEIK